MLSGDTTDGTLSLHDAIESVNAGHLTDPSAPAQVTGSFGIGVDIIVFSPSQPSTMAVNTRLLLIDKSVHRRARWCQSQSRNQWRFPGILRKRAPPLISQEAQFGHDLRRHADGHGA
jgi:hypothetical protein